MKIRILTNQTKELFCDNFKSKENIKLLGKLPRNVVYRYMQSADVFLFPRFEGGGNATLEAMLHELPVVCLDRGSGEMIPGNCAVKVRTSTFKETARMLAEALLQIANDRHAAVVIGTAGRQYVIDNYAIDVQVKFFGLLYDASNCMNRNY